MRHRRAGFTLIELMAVLLIIGILVVFFTTSGMGLLRDTKRRQAEAQMTTLSSNILEYRSFSGDFPSDRLPPGAGDNGLNSPAEALYVALFDPRYSGQAPKLEWLVNTDNDATARSLTSLPERELFEIGDPWGNPVLYFDYRRYAETEATVHAGPEGEVSEQRVRPRKSVKTGAWHEPNAFQLLSAGEDGVFGTDDDVANYTE